MIIRLKTNKWAVNIFPGSSAVEQTTVNRLAGGSNPSRGAITYITFPKNLQFRENSLP